MIRGCKNSSLKSGLTVLSFLLTTACSLGTEVGNGLKPGNPGSAGSGASPDSSASSDDKAPKSAYTPFASASDDSLFTPFNNGESFGQVAAIGTGGQIDPFMARSLASGVLSGGVAASSGIGSGTGAASGASVFSGSELAKIKSDLSAVPVAISDSQLTEANFPLLLVDLAFTGCGSPLADLSAVGAAAFKLSISGEQRGNFAMKPAPDFKTWEIRGSDGGLVRTVTPITISNSGTTIQTVSSSDASGAALRPISVCSDFKSTAGETLAGRPGKFTKRTVKLATSKGYSQLIWYSSGSDKIVQVSLTANADAIVPFAVFDTP